MPDDLLRFVVGPTPLSGWWLALPVVIAALLIIWYTAVFAMTPAAGRRTVLQRATDALGRRRALHAVRRIRSDLAAGGDARIAARDLNRVLREFLQRATGERVEYMPVSAIRGGEFGYATTLFERIDDARFNASSAEDVAALSVGVEEMIASWT